MYNNLIEISGGLNEVIKKIVGELRSRARDFEKDESQTARTIRKFLIHLASVIEFSNCLAGFKNYVEKGAEKIGGLVGKKDKKSMLHALAVHYALATVVNYAELVNYIVIKKRKWEKGEEIVIRSVRRIDELFEIVNNNPTLIDNEEISPELLAENIMEISRGRKENVAMWQVDYVEKIEEILSKKDQGETNEITSKIEINAFIRPPASSGGTIDALITRKHAIPDLSELAKILQKAFAIIPVYIHDGTIRNITIAGGEKVVI